METELEKLIEQEMKYFSEIVSIYKVHDNIMKDSPDKFACEEGCSFCCNQLVSVTDNEWIEIETYIEKNNLRETIQKRNEDTIYEWQKYKLDNWEEISKDGKKPFNDWHGHKPCIFLNNEGACDIYEVRPYNCRCLNSTIKCTKHKDQEGVAFLRYNFEFFLGKKIWNLGKTMSIIDKFIGIK